MLEVYAPDGTMVFNSNQSNFTLKQKVTVNAGSAVVTEVTAPNAGYPYVITVTNCLAPFIAMRGASGVSKSLTLITAVPSGSSITYTFISNTTGAVTFYVFDFCHIAITNPNNSKVGLQTFNSSGQLTLDLNQGRLMRPISELEVDVYGAVTPPVVSVPSGKQYAIGFIEVGHAIQQLTGEQFSVRFGSIGTDSSGRPFASYTSTIFNQYLDESSVKAYMLVVDVTGY